LKTWLFLGSLTAGLAVALGAFAAHGLEDAWSSQPKRLAIFETAARYQMYHGLALVGVALLHARWTCRWLNVAGPAFVVGILLFSGSLYLLAATEVRWLGAITPLGGVGFLIGWLSLAMTALTTRDQ
jgi:uncharacterized membrane protein YgdD (TMEM256/DUF423 family)